MEQGKGAKADKSAKAHSTDTKEGLERTIGCVLSLTTGLSYRTPPSPSPPTVLLPVGPSRVAENPSAARICVTAIDPRISLRFSTMSDAAKSADFFDDIDHPKMELLRASEAGSVDLVESLLSSGVDVDSANDDCESVLQMAAACGHLKLVELLLDWGSDIESENIVGFTPFLHACRNGHTRVVDLLLQRGADPTRTTSMGASALTLAIASNSVELVKKLLAFMQLDIDQARQLAPTPLMAAVYRDSPKLCGLLVRRGANPNLCHQGLRQITPLALSIMLRCSAALFSTLLELGASPERTWLGQSVHHMIERVQRLSLKDILENNSRGLRPLKENHVDVRKLVLDGRLDLLEKTLKERVGEPLAHQKDRLAAALHFAAIVGNLEAVRLLVVDSNCDLNAQDGCGMTALLYALVCGHNDVAKCLLSLQADVFRRTSEKFGSFNALDIAYFSRKLLPTTSLDRAFGSFGLGSRKTWITKVSGKLGLAESPSDASETALLRRKEFLAELSQSHVDWSRSDRFVLPCELLQGDKKVERIREMRPDDFTAAARRLAYHCITHGLLLKEFPIGVPSTSLDSPLRPARLGSSYGSYRLHSSEGSRSLESSGSFASVAQQLAFEFVSRTSRVPELFVAGPAREGPKGAARDRPPEDVRWFLALELSWGPASASRHESDPAALLEPGGGPCPPPVPELSQHAVPAPLLRRPLRHLLPLPREVPLEELARARTLRRPPLALRLPSPSPKHPGARPLRHRTQLELLWKRLEHANLGEYRAVFEKEELDEETIIQLTERDLVQINVVNAEHRQKLLKIIRAFQSCL
uniref:SAM domain-containing protein n=1 Tax=Steinernema glaseri TaxID=37863 RepID=A0A1I7YYA1_9BILA